MYKSQMTSISCFCP